MKSLFVIVLIALLSTGCQIIPVSLPGGETATPLVVVPSDTVVVVTLTLAPPVDTPLPPSPTTAPVVETPATGDPDRAVVENFTYQLDHTPDGFIPLQNGRFELNQADPPVRVTSELVDPPAFGDLNGDGVSDAVVLLRTNTGGTGSFYDLIPLLNQGGTLVQAGSASIGDRQVINDLRVENGRIILDYLTQGPQDALCCPSQHVLRTYRVEENAPILASEQLLVRPDEVATPVPVQIFIDIPKVGEHVSSPIEVAGRIDQVPAQGYVEYYLTDYFATLLESGQIPVSPLPGGGGTFSAQVPFDAGAASISILNLEVVYAENGLLYGRSVVQLFLP